MRKAFTLIEIVVTLAITTIVIGIVSTAIIDSLRGFAAVSNTAKLQNEAVTLNGQYQELLKNATASEIRAAVPSTFAAGSYYIYSDGGNIFYKDSSPDSSPYIIFVTQNSEQEGLFTRLNDQTISADFTITENGESYTLNTSTFMSNSERVTGIPSGRCIVYTTTVSEESFYLSKFTFEKSRNNASNVGGYGAGHFGTNRYGKWSALRDADESKIISIIDQEKERVDVYLPILKPAMSNWEGFFLMPTIEIAGPEALNYTFNTTHVSAKRYTNADVNLTSQMTSSSGDNSPTRQVSASFVGINQVFVHSKTGEVKMYSIFVHYKDASYVEPTFTDLTIIPTKKTVSPTTSNFNDLSDYQINSSKIMMPTEGHTLNALFKTTADSYTVKWYAVNTQADVENFASKTAAEKAACVIAQTDNQRTLDISTLVSTSKNPIGKYVFFSVESSGGTPVFSNATTNPYNLANFINPHVYIQLDYGKMWETTLNEVDYFYGGAFKMKTVENAYNLSETFRNSYENINEFTFGANETNSVYGVVSKSTYSNMVKSIKCGFLTNTLDFQYQVSLKDRTMRITGDRIRKDSLAGWEKDYWQSWDVNGILTNSHTPLLSINPYKDYYTDKQVPAAPSTSSAIAGLNISFSSPAKGVGGISVNPTTTNNYLISADKGYLENFGGEGGRFDVIFKRADASYGLNSQTTFKNEDPGVKLAYGSSSQIFDRGTANDRPALGASNVARISDTFAETPYTLTELNKQSGNLINPNGPTDFTFQFLGNSVTTGVSGKITALRLINNQNSNKSNVMFFGNFYGASTFYEDLFGSVFNDNKYSFKYNNNANTAVLNGVVNTDPKPDDYNVNGLYPSTDIFTTLFEPSRPVVQISAWGYDSSMGPVDFSITGFRPILPSDLN